MSIATSRNHSWSRGGQRRLKQFSRMLAVSMFMVAFVNNLHADENRVWTSSDGKFKTTASIVNAAQDRVTLRRADNGKTIVVRLNQLTKGDQEFVKAYLRNGKSASTDAGRESAGAPAESELPRLTFSKLDDETYQFAPHGTLRVPEPGYRWTEVADQTPQTFVAKKDGSPDIYTLTILPPADSSEARRARMKQDWEQTLASLEKSGVTPTIQLLPPTKERLEYIEEMMYSTDKPAKRDHVLCFGFMAGLTFRLEHEGDRIRLGDHRAGDVLKSFQPMRGPEMAATDLPASVRLEMYERVALLKRYVDADDYAAIVREFTSRNDYQNASRGNEVDRRSAVMHFSELNKPFMRMFVDSLDVAKARYFGSGDIVAFPDAKPTPVEFRLDYGRWTLPYPRVFPKATAGDLLNAAPKTAAATPQPNSEQASKAPSQATKPSVEKIDADWAMFAPCGRVPIPESGFEWKLAAEKPPRIVANKQVLEGNIPKEEVEISVEVLPATPMGERLALVQSRSKLATERMKAQQLSAIQSDADTAAEPKLKDSYTFNVEGWKGAGRPMAISFAFLFLDDKTVVIEVDSQGRTRDLKDRAFRLMLFLKEGIAKQSEWYPRTSVPAEVKQGVDALVAQTIEHIRTGKHREVFEQFVPPKVLESLKADPKKLDDAIEQFKTRKALPLVQILQSLDWNTAKYDASQGTVAFPAGPRPIVFKLEAGQWKIQN